LLSRLVDDLQAGRYPGVILYSEIFQITGPIRRSANYIAGHGYVVIVPEIYHELEAPGTVFAYDPPGTQRGNDHKAAKEFSAHDSDTAACIAWLKSFPHCTGRVGSAGL
jgi:carboxymethylenebutenolidase